MNRFVFLCVLALIPCVLLSWVEIHRDEWGVPHIFGKTDVDVAYGLAYAHCEDDFYHIQQSIIMGRGMMAATYGMQALPYDLFLHMLQIWPMIEREYETQLSEQGRAILEAYAQGVNRFVEKHPERVEAPVFPVCGKDIVAGAMLKLPAFLGLESVMMRYFDHPLLSLAEPTHPITMGSNVLAATSPITQDGVTLLAVNSHQPWSGHVTWYEAHLHSEEGWNMVGGLFPGSPAVILGHNPYLGWGFTVNRPDLIDIYQLEIHPENPDLYRFDDEWTLLERQRVEIPVRVIGNIRFPFFHEILWSVYGPTLRNQEGAFSFRYAGMDRLGVFEQLYWMNRAESFEQWVDALSLGHLPMFNIGYADAQGTVAFVYHALFPDRHPGYDWRGILPGNTSQTLWTGYIPVDELPWVIQPDSGFIQNTNSSPYFTTLGKGNPRPEDFCSSMGIETRMTNRAFRALELFEDADRVDWDLFVQIKFDDRYSLQSDIPIWIQRLHEVDHPWTEEEQRGLDILHQWDLRAAEEQFAPSLLVLTLVYARANYPSSFSPSGLVSSRMTVDELVDSFTHAVAHLLDHFGSVEVPWNQVNRLRRGELDLPIGGGPDLLFAIYGELTFDGRLKGFNGDCYTVIVQWDANGALRSESIHQFGSATMDAASPHYADQSPLFAEKGFKPVRMTKEELLPFIVRSYVP